VSYAESIGAFDVFFGACDADHSGFPDCRPSYIRAFEAAINQGLNLAPGQRMQIHAPLLNLTKQETLNLGVKLGVDYSLTVTCYQATADGLACGVCSSCQIRHQGFLAADLPDVTRYVKN
jgi:7-cyano-7-deazaguanine synthase